MKVFIHIPCPTYLRKFVEASFGENYELNQTDWLGILVLSLLQKKSHPTYHYAGQKKSEHPDKLQFNFSIHQGNKNGYFLVSSDEQKIIRAIDYIFRDQIYRAALLNHDTLGIQYRSTITSYLDTYNITEEDLAYETLQKDFDRKKKNFLSN